MQRILSQSESSIPAIGCITFTSRQRNLRFARIRPALDWYTRRTPGFMALSEDKLRPAPDVGADSRAVLLDAGFDGDAIDNFVSAGVVRTSVR